MLRSFQYTEKSYLNYTMQSDLFREKEIEIARKYVNSHTVRKDMYNKCPVCGKNTGKYFYTKWNVDYLCCTECKSVFAVYDDDVVEQYHKLNELVELRLEDDYQKQITQSREGVWEEFLDWVSVRAFRFMRRNDKLNIVDAGNRFSGYSECIQRSSLCGKYDLRYSMLKDDSRRIQDNEADIVFYLDQMQKELNPQKKLLELRSFLKEDGLLVVSTRAGSGFDIITLKENNEKIYPYEHIFLPSVKGLLALLEQCGYEVLEITTPGVMDVKYVMDYKDKLDDREGFVHYLLQETNQGILQEFQRFLQKSCLSSFVCVIARKGKSNETV